MSRDERIYVNGEVRKYSLRPTCPKRIPPAIHRHFGMTNENDGRAVWPITVALKTTA